MNNKRKQTRCEAQTKAGKPCRAPAKEKTMNNKRKQTRCEAHTKAGKPCRAPAMEGGRLCFLHANPAQARHLGRLGGLKNRHSFPEAVDSLPAASTAAEVLKNATQIMNDVYAGKVQPKVAISLAPFLSLQLRAVEILELEWYAERSRKQSAKAQSEQSAEKRDVPQLASGRGADSETKSDAEDSSDKTDPTDDFCPEGDR